MKVQKISDTFLFDVPFAPACASNPGLGKLRESKREAPELEPPKQVTYQGPPARNPMP